MEYAKKDRWTLRDLREFENIDELKVISNGKDETWQMSWIENQVEVYVDEDVLKFINRFDGCQSVPEFLKYMAEFENELTDEERSLWTAFITGKTPQIYTLRVTFKPEDEVIYFPGDANIQEVLKEGLEILLIRENAKII